jgi:hypothetical protein
MPCSTSSRAPEFRGERLALSRAEILTRVKVSFSIEPDVLETHPEVGITHQLEQPFDMIRIDVGQQQELEAALGRPQRREARLQGAVCGVPAAVDQDAARTFRVAILDPEAVALACGQHVDTKKTHRFRMVAS